MELYIEGSKSNPKVDFDLSTNKLKIHGRSVLKNMDDGFFRPVFSFLEKYISSNEKGLSVEFYIDYFNTSSHPSFIKIFELAGSINDSKLIWLYDQNDLEMMEIGQELQAFSPIKFDIKVAEII